jgi:DNA-binding GntR family transcriptional regulator
MVTPETDKESRKKGDVDTDEAVYNTIRKAILAGLLPPGLKLQEPALARAMDVSRERVRKALHRLAHERWLETVPNRGTFVPNPSVEELHAIYEARKIIEAGIARLLASRQLSSAADVLRAHVALEQEAGQKNDRPRMFHLSAEFHRLLAELTNNNELLEMFTGLMMRSSLHFSLYAPHTLHNCAGPHEHVEIAEAICEGNVKRAETLMRRHLRGLETMLAVRRRTFDFVSLEDSFARVRDV